MWLRIAVALVLAAAPLRGQLPAFDVVSIKPNKSGAPGSETDTLPGRITLINVTPVSLVLRAFGVPRPQILGVPGWATTERYDVVVTVAEGRVLNDRDRQPFFQQMLEDRWQLRFHRETRRLRVYSLVVSDTARLALHAGAGEYAMKVENAGPHVILRSTRGNMGRLAEILTGFVGNSVIDDTGLTGEYDFTLDWVREASAEAPGPSLFTALREQAGLRLVAAEKDVPVVVIDRLERPSPN
jgi:uncharacterized protein (TIGR03435 family)